MHRFSCLIGAVVFLTLGLCLSCERRSTGYPDAVANLSLADIRKLPVGLRVTHSPNPVRAVENGRSGHRYTWLYRTEVEALERSLTITEFGAFYLQNGEWTFGTFTGDPFTPEDFAEWYACPDAKLNPGQPFADPLNWSGGEQLREGKTIWYFIAVDDLGKHYHGEAMIHQLPEIAEPQAIEESGLN